MNTPSLAIDIASTKTLIDTRIKQYCDKQKLNAESISPRYAELWESISSLLAAGGKRLRPHLLMTTYLGYSVNGKVDDIIDAALSQEILHSAMLIHDDIIDRDTVRYGVKNIAGKYNQAYEPFVTKATERSHMSLSAALLAGDILIADSQHILRDTQRPRDLVDKASAIMSHAIFEVVGGELLDTEISFLPTGTINAETVARFKTASYSFTSPLTTGAVLAGAPEKEVNLLAQLSEKLGIGYQMRDDMLGIFGDKKMTGKSTTTDIVEGKRTFLIERFESLASGEQQERFSQIFRRADASKFELEEVRQLLTVSGARKDVETQIDALRSDAQAIIDRLNLNDLAKQEMHAITHRCLKRGT